MAEAPDDIRSATAGRSLSVQPGIPSTRAERDRLVEAIREHLDRRRAVPPLSAEDLLAHTDRILAAAGIDPAFRNYAAVLVNNEIWQDALAGVPYDRRLLLLPQCLRDAENCRGKIDELGLLCRHCGRCCLGDLKAEAERLGYAVLIAEGSPVVMSLIESGKVEAVVGVSCLAVLEKVFPYMESAAVPGAAVPLLRDGCVNTAVDLDTVWETLYLTRDDQTRRMNLEALRREVQAFFTAEALAELPGPAETQTEALAREWLARSGKRWRPFLAACAFRALQPDVNAPLPADLRHLAVAVECFHKASLIHDDIEDDDDLRDGRKTLHAEHGVPIALNIGDYLLGLGYGLIAECAAPADHKARMLQAAARGHRELCVGQGEELFWTRRPRLLPVTKVLDIFRRKTSPAFEVALRLGALYAGAGDDVCRVLAEYSEVLGVAYQVRDDLADFGGQAGDGRNARPSVLAALAWDRADAARRGALEAAWADASPEARRQVERMIADLGAEAEARSMLQDYKLRALRCLSALDNANLKGLLRRVVGRIFKDAETLSCCHDYRTGHAAGRRTREGSSR